jgi:hypothetical protein
MNRVAMDFEVVGTRVESRSFSSKICALAPGSIIQAESIWARHAFRTSSA